ncbi:uncharacterized protein LOC123887209 [Trifolium pratense]|uniref:uncharacterized protein LOC123887209 n=1 Tax=Trifolium pratense TaxID=57577 RepID=UPI001E6904A4|nr:uncharacterized protein LOC123887209 [Trifolium pratense]
MEEKSKYQIQEFKHACKFCNKSFPCGRSLGGHMRSHINNLSSEKTEQKEKVSIKINNGSCIDHSGSYGLRENPKKTWRKRVAESSEDSYVYDKFCKECGKCFQSWKALFGHMKCHSDQKERVFDDSLEDQDSWTNNAKDVESDNEITAPRRKRRSKRTRTRYNNMVGSSTAATVTTATTSSSVSEVEHEQEEVAISLIMLSRDVSPWSGFAESSDNNSVYFEARSSVRTNLVTKFDAKNKNFSTTTTVAAAAAATSTINIAKLMKQSEKKSSVSKKLNFKGKSLEILDTEKGFKMNKTGVSIKGFLKSTKSELDYVSTLEDSEVENGKSRVNGTESAMNMGDHEDEFIKNFHKRGKFECTTCNKIFHSYQALGGHRASHKKTKGCFASKIESSENSIEFVETDLSHEPITESKVMKISDNNIEYVQNMKIKGHHECPICFKVFQSGQALGGHKRSHMVVAATASESRVLVQEQVPQIRDFLDLNLPASTEEESNSHADSNRPWWIVEGNQQEALVG